VNPFLIYSGLHILLLLKYRNSCLANDASVASNQQNVHVLHTLWMIWRRWSTITTVGGRPLGIDFVVGTASSDPWEKIVSKGSLHWKSSRVIICLTVIFIFFTFPSCNHFLMVFLFLPFFYFSSSFLVYRLLCSLHCLSPCSRKWKGVRKLSDLPEELIREILLRLSDYKDLVNSAGAVPSRRFSVGWTAHLEGVV